MDETQPTRQAEPSNSNANSWPWDWFGASVFATVGISLAAAHAPNRVRLIGLLSIAFGLLVGWLVGCLAGTLDARPSRRLIGIVAALLSLAGLVGSTWETARLDELQNFGSAKEQIARRLVEQPYEQGTMMTKTPIDSSALSTFRWHLSHRIRQLGRWPSPWPEAFWLGELVAASFAAAWVSRQSRWTASTRST